MTSAFHEVIILRESHNGFEYELSEEQSEEQSMSKTVVRAKKRRFFNGRISFVIIVVFLVVVMSIAMIMLVKKDLDLKEVEAKKQSELIEQQQISQELSDKENYTHTAEYVENTAKNKLGLVKEDEIIYREK